MADVMSIIMTGIFTLVGTFGGIGLGYWFNERSSKKKEKTQIKALRTLFKSEIDTNLELIKIFIGEIWTIYNDDYNDYSLEIIANPLPDFNNLIWRKQNLMLTLAFNENEIKYLQDFYSSLKTLESTYNHIKYGIEENKKRNISQKIPIPSYLGGFKKDSRKFIDISERLIKEGNPIVNDLDI